jgi:hypothetical protein
VSRRTTEMQKSVVRRGSPHWLAAASKLARQSVTSASGRVSLAVDRLGPDVPRAHHQLAVTQQHHLPVRRPVGDGKRARRNEEGRKDLDRHAYGRGGCRAPCRPGPCRLRRPRRSSRTDRAGPWGERHHDGQKIACGYSGTRLATYAGSSRVREPGPGPYRGRLPGLPNERRLASLEFREQVRPNRRKRPRFTLAPRAVAVLD